MVAGLDNQIPADSDFIKGRINVSGDINFKELIDNGFLVDASGVLARCTQDAIVETETEAEGETEAKTEKTSLVGVVGWWNGLADTYSLPKLKKLTTSRQKSLEARAKDAGSLTTLQDLLSEALENSDHLIGKNDREWKADFDWLMKPDNYIKAIEGKYNRKGAGGQPIAHYGATAQLFVHYISDDMKAVAKELQGANAESFLLQFYVDAKKAGVKLTHNEWLNKIREKGK